jgi:Tol biopolymer transport system component
VAPGSAVVHARLDGKSGSATVEVSAVPVASLELDALQVTVAEGQSRTLVAIAKDASGGILHGRPFSWTSQDPTIATIDESGRLTGILAGSTSVTATSAGHSATAHVTVTLVPVASISVSPSTPVIEIGEQRQLQVIVKDAQGNLLEGRQVQWSLDNANASITPGGVLTGLRNGYVTVTAASEGVSTSIGGTIVEPIQYDWDLLYHRANLAGESELFTLSLSGGSVPFRLNAGTVSRGATGSPDGLRVAFAVSMTDLIGERIDDLFAVDRNGMNMKRLTTAAGIDDSPDWSPAGGRIAWVHWEIDGRSDIWVMNPDGTGQVNLTADMPATGIRREPAWSRNGTRIAFAQFENGPNGTTASIWIMNADGSGKQQLTSTLTGFDASPTWAPGGQEIAFTRYYAGEPDITVVDVNAGTLRRITLAGSEAGPAWSPDGSMIAFTMNGQSIYTMRPDGGQLRLRTMDPTWGGGLAPAWINRQQ